MNYFLLQVITIWLFWTTFKSMFVNWQQILNRRPCFQWCIRVYLDISSNWFQVHLTNAQCPVDKKRTCSLLAASSFDNDRYLTGANRTQIRTLLIEGNWLDMVTGLQMAFDCTKDWLNTFQNNLKIKSLAKWAQPSYNVRAAAEWIVGWTCTKTTLDVLTSETLISIFWSII